MKTEQNEIKKDVIKSFQFIGEKHPEISHLCNQAIEDVVINGFDVPEESASNFIQDFFSEFTVERIIEDLKEAGTQITPSVEEKYMAMYRTIKKVSKNPKAYVV